MLWRLAVPATAISLCVGILMLIMLDKDLHEMWLEELQGEVSKAGLAVGIIGRALLSGRRPFPEAGPPAPVPGEIPEKAPGDGIFSHLGAWGELPGSPARFAAAAVLKPDGGILAAALNPGLAIDPRALGIGPSRQSRALGGRYRLAIDFLDDPAAGRLIRNRTEILGDSGDRLGYALAIFQMPGGYRGARAILAAITALLLIQWAGILLACRLAAGRQGAAILRLAEDLRAVAGGDFSRRSESADPGELGLLGRVCDSLIEGMNFRRNAGLASVRLENDLEVARNIQNSLLPTRIPAPPGVDIQVAYRPAREIGGDYYDFLPLDERRLGIIVADASGKSIPAALLISTTRAVLRFVALSGASPGETMRRVNAVLVSDLPKGMFVTACYLVLDLLDHSLLCASAGHTPLLIARGDGTVEEVNPDGIALGFDTGPIFLENLRERKVRLEAGDRVAVYTDGVVECVNSVREEYSDSRLREFLSRNRGLSSREFTDRLLADLDRFRGGVAMADDITLVTFGLGDAPGEGAKMTGGVPGRSPGNG
ncbi:MAG: PP2C family protein-serine/threonine phosphatase [Planctomycetota bacterium]|nr:PP2C family protein-serine/threonine phosphatase [Planctomycetota bacterium]